MKPSTKASEVRRQATTPLVRAGLRPNRTPLSETKMSDRNWRFDDPHELDPVATGAAPGNGETPESTRSGTSRLARWKGLAVEWARSSASHLVPTLAAPGEQILHEFATMLAREDDPELIGQTLNELASRMVKPHRVEWTRTTLVSAENSLARTFLARHGHSKVGQLVIRAGEGLAVELDALTCRRLSTLCAMAAASLIRTYDPNSRPAARESLRPVTASVRTSPQECENLPIATAHGANLTSGHDARTELEASPRPSCLTPGVQDATFLSAVLPYAIGQARRHDEPLSILCVEIDRLGGILELLGRDRADQAFRGTGIYLASQVRASDFVARLDDDRFLTVLPRAGINDACRIAENLCQGVARNSAILPEVSGVTVSVGVAEFPACADTVYALIDAADHALSMAKSRGRNQAAAAPLLRSPDPLKLARCAS
jgi:diguanylate cyclase (GGDEF)-like protein